MIEEIFDDDFHEERSNDANIVEVVKCEPDLIKFFNTQKNESKIMGEFKNHVFTTGYFITVVKTSGRYKNDLNDEQPIKFLSSSRLF